MLSRMRISRLVPLALIFFFAGGMVGGALAPAAQVPGLSVSHVYAEPQGPSTACASAMRQYFAVLGGNQFPQEEIITSETGLVARKLSYGNGANILQFEIQPAPLGGEDPTAYFSGNTVAIGAYAGRLYTCEPSSPITEHEAC